MLPYFAIIIYIYNNQQQRLEFATRVHTQNTPDYSAGSARTGTRPSPDHRRPTPHSRCPEPSWAPDHVTGWLQSGGLRASSESVYTTKIMFRVLASGVEGTRGPQGSGRGAQGRLAGYDGGHAWGTLPEASGTRASGPPHLPPPFPTAACRSGFSCPARTSWIWPCKEVSRGRRHEEAEPKPGPQRMVQRRRQERAPCA